MIIASDLDRTLIYSQRALEDLDGLNDFQTLKPVEKKDGKWIAFMTIPSFEILQNLGKHHFFVPVTTRTTEQYNRVKIFQDEISVLYAVTSNGAHILYKGRPDDEWKKRIDQKLQHECILQAELIIRLEKEGFHFKGQLKQAENLFFYYILENRISSEFKQVINDMVFSFGWRVSQQGKKLYFIPKCINKGSAIEFIREREGIQTVVGAGDSLLDKDFLQHCQTRFVPVHGELALEKSLSGYNITMNSGVHAGEEILSSILHLTALMV